MLQSGMLLLWLGTYHAHQGLRTSGADSVLFRVSYNRQYQLFRMEWIEMNSDGSQTGISFIFVVSIVSWLFIACPLYPQARNTCQRLFVPIFSFSVSPQSVSASQLKNARPWMRWPKERLWSVKSSPRIFYLGVMLRCMGCVDIILSGLYGPRKQTMRVEDKTKLPWTFGNNNKCS